MTDDERELLILVGQVLVILTIEAEQHKAVEKLANLLRRVTDANKLKLVGDE